MLRRNSSDSHLGMHSGNSASVIMKHKIRNLRAKLKTLLTSQSCTKHSKRQKCVRKLQHGQNKQFQLTCQQFNLSKQLFMYSKQSAKKYWYSPEQKCDIMNVFGKLSNEQIQQIKEDMIYYLGEDNIDKFKAFEEIKIEKEWNKENLKRMPFLKRMKTFKSEDTQRIAVSDENEKKETERRQEIARQKKQFDFQQENPVSKRQKNCSIFDKFQCFRKSFQSNNTPISNKRLNTANLIQSRASTITKRTSSKQQQKLNHKFQTNYLGNRQNFLQKRHIIEQQEKAQRIITKITMQMKHQKAVDVFRMTKDAFLSTIKQKNTMNDFKTKKILEDKYKKNVTFGQIVELNQELRKIYIKKISPNSNLGSIYPQTDDRYLQPVIKRSNYDTTLSNFFSPSNYKYKY